MTDPVDSSVAFGQQWFSTALTSIGEAVIATDAHGRVIFMNPVAQTLTGWQQAEARGRQIIDVFSLIHEMSRDVVENPVAKVIATGTIVGHANHTVLLARDGTETPIDDSAAPIVDSQGQIQGTVLVFRDITAQKRAEAERKEADRRKDEFLAMLAHELRNPISTISNAVQILRLPTLTHELDWAKEVIERQVKHLARMIDDLLDVSRITRGKIRLRMERVDAARLVNSALDDVRPLIDERRHRLIVSLEPRSLWLDADPVRVQQVLVNLLTNAAKYTDTGGTIWVSVRLEEGQVIMIVGDTGIGIPPEKLSTIFELFSQGDRTMARSEGGLGVGLTVVQKLVELHGGNVSAASAGIGAGSEFTVRLPAVDGPEATLQEPQASPMTAKGSRVLVVDDNVDTANALEKLLSILGHDVRTVYDGEAALTAAIEHRPAIILLDIGLPGIDGYQVAERLRQDDRSKHSILIAVTGYGQEQDRRRARQVGFDHYLVKPVDHKVLLSIIS